MHFGIGIVFAVLCAFCKAVDTLLNKGVLRNISATNHTLYRVIFTAPVLFVAALLNWRLSAQTVPYMLLYGVLEAVNIFSHQMAMKRSESLHIEIISKSKVVFTLILSFVLVIDTLSLLSTVGIGIFMVGAVLAINFQNKSDTDRTDATGIFLEIVSVLARTFKPFILKTCIQKGLATNETMAFTSLIIAFVLLLAVFRPKLDFKNLPIKTYSLQALIAGCGMLFSGWAITNANIVLVNAIESTTVIFVMIASCLMYKKKYTKMAVAGSLLSVAGIVFAIIF